MSARLRLLALSVTVAILFTATVVVLAPSAHRVRDWVHGYGALGPLVFICLSAALTVACFPGPVLAAASGLLFGTALGFPVTLTAAVAGALLAFSFSRRAGRSAVEELAGPRLRAVQAWVERRGFLAVLYARIAPGVPYTVVNYAAGLTRVRIGAFAAATTLGAAPRAFAYTALGGHLGNLSDPQALVAVGVLVAMAAAGGAIAWRQRRGGGPASGSAGR